MAFKKFDFSKLDTAINSDALAASRRAALDKEIFGDKPMARTTIDLTWETRSTMDLDLVLIGISERDQRIEVILQGDRIEAYKTGLGRALQNHYVELCDEALEESRAEGGEGAMPDLDGTALRIIAEGIWKPRRWKDRQGVWHTRWTFILAQWHYQIPGKLDGWFIVEGRLPGADAEAVTPVAVNG